LHNKVREITHFMADAVQCYAFLSWVNMQRYALKIGNLMKAAYSVSCFSNDSDYYRAYVKWKSVSY